MRAEEFITEISDETLQSYLGKAELQVSNRLDRMSRASERLNKNYEIYDVTEPTRIINRFEADTPQQARSYYTDFIQNYNSDVDFEFGLRRSTGLYEKINNDITQKTWHAEKTITLPDVGTLMLRARNTSDVVPPQFVVDVYTPENPNKSIGHFRFLVLDWEPPKTTWFARKSKRDPYVIGGNVRVWDQYQKKGIARAVYAWIKSLGNDVRPSTTRTPAGMSMWNSFERNPLEENTKDFEGLTLKITQLDPSQSEHAGFIVTALDPTGGKELGYVVFADMEHNELDPRDLYVDERYQGQGIARVMYDYVKSLGYRIHRSPDQTPAGRGFWDKHRGPDTNVWENTNPVAVKLGPQLYAPRPKNLNEALKPQAKLWTSSAKKTNLGYTSAWVKWAEHEMPGWVGDQGLLFDVAPGAKILTINSDRDAVRIAKQYGANVKDAISLFMNMPWDKIAQDYDAIHHVPSNRSVNVFMNAWDVESTAWLNTDFLINQRPVKIAKSHQNQGVAENFADGKGPGRPGDSVRHGIPKHATMAELEKASHAKGRKGQLARWQLNMRRGHKK